MPAYKLSETLKGVSDSLIKNSDAYRRSGKNFKVYLEKANKRDEERDRIAKERHEALKKGVTGLGRVVADVAARTSAPTQVQDRSDAEVSQNQGTNDSQLSRSHISEQAKQRVRQLFSQANKNRNGNRFKNQNGNGGNYKQNGNGNGHPKVKTEPTDQGNYGNTSKTIPPRTMQLRSDDVQADINALFPDSDQEDKDLEKALNEIDWASLDDLVNEEVDDSAIGGSSSSGEFEFSADEE
jgi:hypothetical protein